LKGESFWRRAKASRTSADTGDVYSLDCPGTRVRCPVRSLPGA
jgi:hypothetical protein